MRRLRTLALGSSVALLALTACQTDESSGSVQPIDAVAAASSATAADDVTTVTVAAAGAATSTDGASTDASTVDSAAATAQDWDTSTEVLVTLTGDGAEVSGADVSGVDVDGSFVEITAPGTYRITGTLADGNVEIDSEVDGLVRIVLDGVDITSSTTSPLAVVQATEAVVFLADDSANVLTDAASYVYPDAETDEPNAALFSDDDLTITGNGTLEVHANFADGIVGKDHLTISGGTIAVTAVDDGIRGNDSLTIDGGTIAVAAGGDGLKSDTELVVNGGVVDVQQSYEGLESAAITITGGDIRVVASDDGINAASETASPTLTITGGSITVDAQGDGLDVNGSITMTGGTVIVNGPTQDMNGALDYDGTFDISGGVLVATGSSGMAMAPGGDSAQLSLLSVFATQQAGSTVTITSSSGQEIVSFTPTKAFGSITVSTADIVADESYDVAVDGTVVDTTTTDEAVSQGGGRGGRRP